MVRTQGTQKYKAIVMRFLIASDIHDKVEAVNQLRCQEINNFDAVVIAGDIGNKAQEIIDIFSSFECHVLYVYGNWDNKHSYNAIFGKNCHHLHLTSFQCGPLAFAGFSGCSESWGQNPIALRLYKSLRGAHKVLNKLDKVRKKRDKLLSDAKAVHSIAVAELKAEAEKTKRPFKAKLNALESKFRSEVYFLDRPINAIVESNEYKAYLSDAALTERNILSYNRNALADVIKKSATNIERTIIVTHKRLYRTVDDLSGAPMFLFGHKHGFADTTFKGTRYINVSPMSHADSYPPERPCNYVILEMSSVNDIVVKRVDLKMSD